MDFENFCREMYTENQIERQQWHDEPITFEDYKSKCRSFLKEAYEKRNKEKSGGEELE